MAANTSYQRGGDHMPTFRCFLSAVGPLTRSQLILMGQLIRANLQQIVSFGFIPHILRTAKVNLPTILGTITVEKRVELSAGGTLYLRKFGSGMVACEFNAVTIPPTGSECILPTEYRPAGHFMQFTFLSSSGTHYTYHIDPYSGKFTFSSRHSGTETFNNVVYWVARPAWG